MSTRLTVASTIRGRFRKPTEDTDRNTIHVAPPLHPKSKAARRSGPPLSSNRVIDWPDYLLVLALARLARHSRNSRYSGSCGARAVAGAAAAGGDAAPDADDTAAPAGSGMLRSSHSCDALKRVQPATVALGASSFHFGWNGGRCSWATLSNMVSTKSARRR